MSVVAAICVGMIDFCFFGHTQPTVQLALHAGPVGCMSYNMYTVTVNRRASDQFFKGGCPTELCFQQPSVKIK